MPLQQLDAAIRWVKDQPVAFSGALTASPSTTVEEALAILPAVAGHGFVVQEEDGTILGCVPASRLAAALEDATLGTSCTARPPRSTPTTCPPARAAFDLMIEADLEFAPVLHHGALVGTLSRTGALRSTIYDPALDADGRLRVAAAVGINGDVAGKARALVAAGVDVLVLDTAHGHQEGMLRALRTVSALKLGVPIAAGNIVTADAVHDLVDAGADILKVGVGPGAMCTTG